MSALIQNLQYNTMGTLLEWLYTIGAVYVTQAGVTVLNQKVLMPYMSTMDAAMVENLLRSVSLGSIIYVNKYV